MEKLKDFFKMMENEEEKDKIVEKIRDEERTEDVEKMSNLDGKIKVYAKWKELKNEIVKLDNEDIKGFMEILKAAIDFQGITFKFGDFMDNNDFESAKNMVGEMQTARNNLAKVTVEFLKI